MARVAFHTLGCKVNQYETESMTARFVEAGYDVVEFEDVAEVYIVNTCTVTNIADKKSRQMLSRAKQNNPDATVVAVGCYVQTAKEKASANSHVDLMVGNTDKSRIVEVVEAYKEASAIPEIEDLTNYRVYDEDLWLGDIHDHTRVHVKIQDGCDQFCSYCIIPLARGRIRSRDKAQVVDEIRALADKGYKEVVLTGIHLASYGKQWSEDGLIELLEELDVIPGLEHIRLGSLEPTLITEQFVERLSKLSHVCPHFHLSLQSGNDITLKAMNRKYTTDQYLKSLTLLRGLDEHVTITTDLIVGFPGETDEHFEETLGFLRKAELADVHVFKYSVREGTKAAKMKEQVDGRVKQGRSQKATRLVTSLKEKYLQGFVGEKLDVLIEERIVMDDVVYYAGHTKHYVKVYIRMEEAVANEFVVGQIVGLKADGLIGELS